MKITPLALPEVLLIEPDVFGDERGYFLETWNRRRYREAGLEIEFVQDNLSFSRKGVLRGLHFQFPHPQGKLVQVLKGRVFDVAVDLRLGSPTFGKWVGVELSEENHYQLYIPEGFAHGFYVLEEALLAYKCTDLYHPECDKTLLWNDPEIAIPWPLSGQPILSPKDQKGRLLRQFQEGELPKF